MVIKKLIQLIVFILILGVTPSYAILTVDIDSGTVAPINVALVGFENNREIESVIKNDLNNSGLFKTSNHNIENLGVNNNPHFESWSKYNIAFTLVGETNYDGKNIRIRFRLWNIAAKKYVAGKSISVSNDKWRQLAHTIADYVYWAQTGDLGYFNTRILYIAESGSFNNRTKRLTAMDYDGANPQYLTNGEHMILTPRISSDNRKILYMSYQNKLPAVFLLDMERNRHKQLGQFNGMTSAPRFGYNTNLVLLALSNEGATNIYKVDLQNLAKKQLTNNSAINTSPSYSPDNQYIAFSSDRQNGSQIYVMHNDGSNQKRISAGNGKYFNPVWSPAGDYIAFSKLLNGTFYIGIMRPNGSEEKILASGFMLESPSWAPNGRLLIFSSGTRSNSSEGAQSHLYMVDITGKYHFKVPTNHSATDPMWSGNINLLD